MFHVCSLLALVRLEWVVDHMDIGPAGYFVLFGLLLACGVGLPLPEDIPLLVSGALIGRGHMNFGLAAVLAWCGIIGGDCILYTFGRKFGLNITKVPIIGTHVTRERIIRAEHLFQRWGIWVVAIGRLFAGIRGAVIIAAGTIRFNFVKLIIADGLAALVSGGLFMFLGYKFGQNLKWISHRIHHAGGWVFLVMAVLVIGLIAYAIWRRKQQKTVSEIAMEKVEQRIDPPKPTAGSAPE